MCTACYCGSTLLDNGGSTVCVVTNGVGWQELWMNGIRSDKILNGQEIVIMAASSRMNI